MKFQLLMGLIKGSEIMSATFLASQNRYYNASNGGGAITAEFV